MWLLADYWASYLHRKINMEAPLAAPAQSEPPHSNLPDYDPTKTSTSQSEFLTDTEVAQTETALATSPLEYVSDSDPPPTDSESAQLELPLSDPANFMLDVIIPESELEREDCIANITDAILAEGMTLREFIMTVEPSASTLFRSSPHPSQSLIVHRTVNIINFINSQHMTIYDFLLALLTRGEPEIFLHQRQFRGTGWYSQRAIRGVFIGMQNLIYGAGNQESVWRDLIQAEADALSVHNFTG
ncbi:uncharacterized protein MELLADRAFT_112744 [Melampsora larici-populina 98AG31]|uniref:Uncharacterized protein n=1 Tax=Melampsora larici-populina (strain 98AG31 / pathotype 3-4-7) TaxID=747676 RepID=F4S7G1_MELLP|nr:uncharacterized protein MELLADRAFT_112744 [Melampsora larici-populina 98AG31]EGF99432.1 hypothetical protein MELLADRAFT_112744 [Melampsora larici-populina 98AG31]